MSALHRSHVEPFQQQALYNFAQLEKVDKGRLPEYLLPVDSALQHYSAIVLDEQQTEAIFHGRKIQLNDAQQLADVNSTQTVRIYSAVQESATFLGLANDEGQGILSSKRLMRL